MQNELTYEPTHPIPRRAIPLPWEDLNSLIMRTAAKMHYRNPLWVVRPQELEEKIEIQNLCLLSWEADYQLLQKLLLLDEETLYQCTYHRFAAQLRHFEELSGDTQTRYREEIHRLLLSYDSITTSFQPYSTTRVCPYCFQEAVPYGRLYWNFRSLLICPWHNIFLIDKCPDCHKSIPSLRPSIIRCSRCKTGDYRQAQCINVDENSIFYHGQKLIWHRLVSMDVGLNEDMKLFSESPLLGLSSRKYFQLINVFFNVLLTLFPDDPFLQVKPEIRKYLRRSDEIHSPFTLYERIALTTTFYDIFASWPTHFFAFLDALSQRRGREGIASYEGQDFGSIGRRIYRDLSEPDFLFLREAYEDYLKTSYVGNSRISRGERYSIVITEAVHKLGIGKDEIDVLINQGLIRSVREPVKVENKTLKQRIEQGSILKLCKEWEGMLPLDEVAVSLLCVSRDTMHMLHEKGLLVATRGPDIDGYPIKMYLKADVNAFIATILSRSIHVPNTPGEYIRFGSLCMNNMLSIEDGLEAVYKGLLVPNDTNSPLPLFLRTTFSYSEIYRWRDVQNLLSEERIFLTREEVASMLGLRKYMITILVQNKLLAVEEGQNLSSPLFHREEVEVFRRTYVFFRETAALLDTYPSNVYEYMNSGRLRPVLGGSGTSRNINVIFRREDVGSLLSNILRRRGVLL